VKTFPLPLAIGKGKRNSEQKKMNATEIAQNEGKGISTIAKRWEKNFPGVPFSRFSELTEEQVSAISKESGKKNTGLEMSERKQTMKQSPSPAVPNEVPPVKKRKQSFDFSRLRKSAIDMLLFAIVAGHSLLIWYDCNTLWGVPGFIGGAIAFLIVLAALMFSMDSELPRTSGTAIWFVFMVDCGAFWVHYPTFKRSATIGDTETMALCVFLCGMSFAALYLFRDSKLS